MMLNKYFIDTYHLNFRLFNFLFLVFCLLCGLANNDVVPSTKKKSKIVGNKKTVFFVVSFLFQFFFSFFPKKIIVILLFCIGFCVYFAQTLKTKQMSISKTQHLNKYQKKVIIHYLFLINKKQEVPNHLVKIPLAKIKIVPFTCAAKAKRSTKCINWSASTQNEQTNKEKNVLLFLSVYNQKQKLIYMMCCS